MFKKFSILFSVCIAFLCVMMIPQTKAFAASVGDRVADGVVVESDASFCGCCHDHNHTGGFAKISCFFCKISQFFKNLFGNAEENAEHKYIITATKMATCKAAGYESYRCAVCDKTATVTFEKLPHKPIDLQAVSADCENSGLTQGSKCSACNTILVKQNVIPASGHAYDNGRITTEPACEKEGTKTFTCTNCGATKTEKVNALVHDWEDEIIKAPTCEEKGARARVCQLCETYIEREDIPSLGHSYDNGVVTTAPGCETEGVKTFTCEACGDTYTESVAATGHSYNESITTEATCTTDGVRTYTCAGCSDAYTESIAALGHIIPSNASVVCYPYNDAQSAGYMTISFACSRCSDPKTGLPYYRNEYNSFKAVIKNASGVSFYATTEAALKASKSGDTVVVGVDDTITADATVPSGVMLLVPCNNAMQGYLSTGYGPDNPGKTGSATLYRTLTIADGATLTVNGTLLINAVTGRAEGGSVLPYGNSGYYGQIALCGDIVVKNSGLFDCSGYVVDNGGSVTLENGAVMYETFAISKWRGGSYVTNHPDFSPIYERTMNNMQASLRIEYGASLIGRVKMYANDMYYYSPFPQIDNANGIIRLKENAYIVREIDTVNSRDIYSFYGDFSFESSALNVAGYNLTTADADFYLFDGDTTFNFYAGTTNMIQNFAMLPGGIVNLYDGAHMIFGGFAGWAMFDSGFYEIEKTLWSEPHKYTSGRPDAVMNVYENASVSATGNECNFVGTVIVDGGTVNMGDKTNTTYVFDVPNNTNTANSYGKYELTLNMITK